MTSERAFVRTFQVAGFTAEVSIPCLAPGVVANAFVEWEPREPDFAKDFTPAQRAQYQRLLMEAVTAANS